MREIIPNIADKFTGAAIGAFSAVSSFNFASGIAEQIVQSPDLAGTVGAAVAMTVGVFAYGASMIGMAQLGYFHKRSEWDKPEQPQEPANELNLS